MTETTYTKGPWTLTDRLRYVRGGNTTLAIATITDGKIFTGICPSRSDDETDANARLIAAAPELAEALLVALEHIGDPCKVCDLELTGIIRAALQKAGLL